jgi:hypothetical protein
MAGTEARRYENSFFGRAAVPGRLQVLIYQGISRGKTSRYPLEDNLRFAARFASPPCLPFPENENLNFKSTAINI